LHPFLVLGSSKKPFNLFERLDPTEPIQDIVTHLMIRVAHKHRISNRTKWGSAVRAVPNYQNVFSPFVLKEQLETPFRW
jgi:hypothetical protein